MRSFATEALLKEAFARDSKGTMKQKAAFGSVRTLVFIVLPAWLCLFGAFRVLAPEREAPRPAGRTFPYGFADHLEEASEIRTPVFRLLRDDRSCSDRPLAVRAQENQAEGITLAVSPSGGRTGRGRILLSAPAKGAPFAAAEVTLGIDPGANPRLSGWVRFLPPEEKERWKTAAVPEARAAWEPAAEAAAGGVLTLRTAPPEGTGTASSGDLLDILNRWRISRRVDGWNFFELPLAVPPGCRALRIRLECRNLVGRVEFSDVRLRSLDFTACFLNDGDYRYLRSTEVTRPLKKMVLLGDTYRASLAAFAPSRFCFDLVLPEHGVLEYHVGIAQDPAMEHPEGKVRFRVLLRPDGKEARELHRAVLEAGKDGGRWHPVRLDLAAWRQQRVRITFETGWAGTPPGDPRPRVIPVIGTPVVYACRRGERKPNLLLVSIDATRTDHLGCHGYGRDPTPFLDTLAAEGVDFTNTYSPGDLTYVVMPILMTGRMMQFKWLGSFNVLDPDLPSLPELLAREGYLCAAFLEDYYYNGFWKGFPARPKIEGLTQSEADVVLLDRAKRFIHGHGNTPWFVWIHLNGPHPPCHGRPPDDRYVKEAGLADALARFRKEAGAGPKASNWIALQRRLATGGKLAPGDRDALTRIFLALYDGQLRRTDERLRAFMAELRSEGALEHTLRVITSDHGMQLRPGALGARGPREEGLRVPFLFLGPGIPQGRRVDARVTTLDLLPTLLDLLHVPAPGGVTGRSLAPLVLGTAEHLDEEPVFSLLTGSTVLWFDRYKYLVSKAVTERLVDGSLDPGAPPQEGESLFLLPPAGTGDDRDVKARYPDRVTRARTLFLERWRKLDRASAAGPANQALVGFFKKAGYMK